MWLLLVTVLGLVTGNSMETERRVKMNPEASMNISEIIHQWGYPSEEYEVLTTDGYYLSLNRIPGGSKASILLVHGLTMEGSVWVENPPHESLGFILADANYDVWIGNVRGSSWSRRHKKFTVEQEEFWNFSFHEMGIYDFPAMTDFIWEKSGQKKIYYAGHAQGSTIAFIALSVIPQLAEKIEMVFAVGPAYTLHYNISPLVQLTRLPPILLKIIFGRKEFSLLSRSSRKVVSQTCSFRIIDELCKQANQLFVSGFHEKNLNESRMDVYFSRFPDYTSVKNIIHWSQAAQTGEFKYFDYGPKNIIKYNQTIPPFYKIEEITVPIAVWSGRQDWVCQPKEISELLSRIHNLIQAKEYPDWNHWDFIWGIDAHQKMYTEILGLMEQ